jgi:uncharacterized protein (DUF488 family)
MGRFSVVTIGHSNYSLAQFMNMVEAFGVDVVVDIRRRPFSSYVPHFNKPFLGSSLISAGKCYVHEEALGHKRDPRPTTKHTALRSVGAAFVDHLQNSLDAQKALDRIVQWVVKERTIGIVCAEAKVVNCHRRYVADALVAERGISVVHVLGPGCQYMDHKLHPMARKLRKGLVYDLSPMEE